MDIELSEAQQEHALKIYKAASTPGGKALIKAIEAEFLYRSPIMDLETGKHLPQHETLTRAGGMQVAFWIRDFVKLGEAISRARIQQSEQPDQGGQDGT